MHEKDKEDVIRFGQNVHTTQAFSKKETLKRPVSSLEDSITKLLTCHHEPRRKASCSMVLLAILLAKKYFPSPSA